MTDRLVMRLGLWFSVVATVLGALYLALLIGTFSTEGFVFPPATFVQLIGGIITFLTAPALLVLFAAIRHSAPTARTILGTLGLAFTALAILRAVHFRFGERKSSAQTSWLRNHSLADSGVRVGSILALRGLGRPGGFSSRPAKGRPPCLAAIGAGSSEARRTTGRHEPMRGHR